MLYQLNYGRTLVGPAGFEPTTLCSQSRCATKLRYGPTMPRHHSVPPGPSEGHIGSYLETMMPFEVEVAPV